MGRNRLFSRDKAVRMGQSLKIGFCFSPREFAEEMRPMIYPPGPVECHLRAQYTSAFFLALNHDTLLDLLESPRIGKKEKQPDNCKSRTQET
jgi:hypothetical protein